MKKYWFKLLSWIGFEIEEFPEEKPESIPIVEKHDNKQVDKPGINNKLGSNIISIHQNKAVKIVYIVPESYDHVQSIADHLRNSRPVIVNMEPLEKTLAKRIMDFLSGTVYAISGSMQKINPNIVIVLPQNFSMLNLSEIKDNVINNDYSTWNKTSES